MTDYLRPPTRAGVTGPLRDSPFAHISHREKRAFLRAYAETGRKRASARMAGIHPDTIYSPAWRDDEGFQEALEVARKMAGDLLEEEMIRRGVEGVRRLRFHGKTGEPLRDPEHCEHCSRPRNEHVRASQAEHGWGPHPDSDCPGFEPGIYVEHEYSDRLLEQLARSHIPDRYGNKLEVTGIMRILKGLDYERLPHHVIDQIADGVHPLIALAGLIDGLLDGKGQLQVPDSWLLGDGGISEEAPKEMDP
jgi:hypothetical protein